MKKTVNLTAAIAAVERFEPASLTVRELASAYDAHHPTKAVTPHLAASWLPAIGDTDAWAVTTDQLERGVKAMLAAGYSPGYTNRQMSALGSAYKWAKGEHLTPRNFRSPTIGVRRQAEAIRRVECSAAEQTRLRDAAFAHRDRRFALYVALLLDTGARPSELLARTWAEIDLDKREILLPRTKTERPRVLFFQPDTAALAQRLRPQDRTRLVFAGRTGEPCKFIKAWRNLRTAVGRPDLHVYDLRHVVAARLLRGGTTLGVASQVMGHSSLIMHRRYGHLETQSLRAAQESGWTKG